MRQEKLRGPPPKIDSDQLKAQLQGAEAQVEAAREAVQEAGESVILHQRQLEEARIALELAGTQSQARINEAEAALKNAQATLTRAKALLGKARKDYERFRQLSQEKVISGHLLDEKLAAYEVAQAELRETEEGVIRAQAGLELAHATRIEARLRQKELESAEGRLAIARSSLAAAESRRKEAEARKREIEADLNDTVLHAPIAGRVLNKLVEAGELVVPGTPIATLLDLSDLYVKAYVPEGEIGKVRLGNPARIFVDSFPGRFFAAHVSEVAQEAEFTPKNVQMKDERTKLVYRVKLRIENPEGFLKPGIPADVLIRWKDGAPWS